MSYRQSLLAALFCILSLSCKGPEGPTGPAGSGAESLTDPSIMPTLLTSYPLDKSTGPYTDFNNRITLRFNKIMDRTSIKRALRLSSTLSDVQLDTTSVAVQNTDVFTLAPLDIRGSGFKFLWKIGTLYTITVDTSAFDVNGNHLRSRISVTFTPEPFFRVTGSTPANGATEVAIGSSITLAFNSLVDTTIASHITIQPPLAGQWSYIPAYPAPDSSQWRFTSQGALLDTVYTVLVDTAARDKFGHAFGPKFTTSFTTSTFRLSTTSPLDGSLGVSVFNTITLTFTAAVDTAVLRNALSIAPATAWSFRYSNSSLTSVILTPSPQLAVNTLYSVTISDSMKSKSGVAFAQPYAFSFTTVPFQISSSLFFPQPVPVSNSFTITTTDYYDTGTVRGSIIVSPNVALKFTLTDNATAFTLRPVTTFASNTNYIVMITTGLHSRRGDSLSIGTGFAFTTAPLAVSSTSPVSAAASVPPASEITVSMTEAVDTATVSGAFSISPPVAGDFVLTAGSATFSFRPHAPLDPFTTYVVALDTSLQSISGAPLPAVYSWSFATSGFQLLSTSPGDHTTDIALTSRITFTFNDALDTSTVRGAFSLSPPADGIFSFTDLGSGYTSFSYTPMGLASVTPYVVSLSTACKSIDGASLSGGAIIHFTTTRFRAVSVSPLKGSVNVPVSQPISISFNGPVDTTGIDTMISIAPSLPGNVVTAEGLSYINYNPFNQLHVGTHYTVTLSGGLRTVGGGTLVNSYSYGFTTVPFQVVSSMPQDGSDAVPKQSAISINLNSPIDTGSVRSAFSITPAAAGDFYLYYPSYGFSFTPSSALAPLTTYTIRVSTAMRTQFGDTLVAPWSAQFVTGN